MTAPLVSRVAARAEGASPVRAALWILAAIPWLVGAVVGVLVAVAVWVWAAGAVGYETARDEFEERFGRGTT